MRSTTLYVRRRSSTSRAIPSPYGSSRPSSTRPDSNSGTQASCETPAADRCTSSSWYEALAYCSWLQEMLATSPALQGSPIARLVREQVSRVTLPTELEWEKAARGGLRDKVFSWGDTPDPNRANCSKSRIFDMSAVACFPPNGFGLCDMIGNVSEWTSSHYKPYPYLADDGREDLNSEVDRVVRGGSFGMNPGSARCAYRYRVQPKFHHSDLGFRVVLRSPPGPS